ncbi:DUF1810 domain-containing protein [Kineococcus glutinatus]|uniref:DUF1810 domain-containing protein n=1 Tax=Kineococcus glutinatus TaxID=1070872 RepID=UPI0031F0BB32
MADDVRGDDPFALRRFLRAQDAQGTYEEALAELRAGAKRSHWMWFVFPQLAGLGRSATAQRYAITGPDEARAYVAHPVLGPRLVAAARALLDSGATDAAVALGGIDARKLHSSATLFALTAPGEEVFREVLERFFGGVEDPGTLRLLGRTGT